MARVTYLCENLKHVSMAISVAILNMEAIGNQVSCLMDSRETMLFKLCCAQLVDRLKDMLQ